MTTGLPPSRTTWRRVLAPALAYPLLAVLITWPLVTDLGGLVVGGSRTDVWNSIWGLWFAAGEGAPWPVRTELLDFPVGGRIALADPLNAWLAAPLVAAWGPVHAYGMLVLAHLSLGGMAAHALGRVCGGRGWIAGVGYVLAPTCLAHLQNGSSEAASLVWLPLACLALVRTLQATGWRVPAWALASAVLLVLTALGGWYAGVGAWVFAVALLLVGWDAVPLRQRILRLGLPLAAALSVTLPIAHQIRGVALAADGLVDIKQASDLARIRRTLGAADPRIFVAPGDFRSPDFSNLLGNPSDYVHTAYLGYVLLGLALLALWRGRERRQWALALAVLTGVVLALGPVVVWDGQPLAMGARGVGLPLPYLALEGLPGLGSLSLLWRLATISALALAVLADRHHPAWALVVVLEVGLLSPAQGLPEVSTLPETSALVALAEAPEGAVLNLPPTASRSYLYEQAVHGKPMVASLNTGINVQGLKVVTAARYLRDGKLDAQGLSGAAHEQGVRYAVVHKDMLMEDHYVEAAVAIKRNMPLVSEDARIRVYALY